MYNLSVSIPVKGLINEVRFLGPEEQSLFARLIR
ncbi:hypothetical protein BSTP3_275 [Bacillus phage BSTP3]|nr:hypothetical protein BSTP3_275 [Bacillus phage BSTP3]